MAERQYQLTSIVQAEWTGYWQPLQDLPPKEIVVVQDEPLLQRISVTVLFRRQPSGAAAMPISTQPPYPFSGILHIGICADHRKVQRQSTHSCNVTQKVVTMYRAKDGALIFQLVFASERAKRKGFIRSVFSAQITLLGVSKTTRLDMIALEFRADRRT